MRERETIDCFVAHTYIRMNIEERVRKGKRDADMIAVLLRNGSSILFLHSSFCFFLFLNNDYASFIALVETLSIVDYVVCISIYDQRVFSRISLVLVFFSRDYSPGKWSYMYICFSLSFSSKER